MQVFFYRLSEAPVEAALPLLARLTLKAGQRLLVVCAEDERRQRLSRALWSLPGSFLAHGEAGGLHDARQPILLAPGPVVPGNGARFIAYADGQWHDPPEGTERAMLLFDDMTIGAARQTWKALAAHEGLERQFWKQEGGRWMQGP